MTTKQPKKHKSVRMIRVVLNLIKSDKNQAVIDEVFAFAKAKSVEGPYACLKKENIAMTEFLTTASSK